MTVPSCQEIADRHHLRKLARSWRGICPACQYRGTGTLSMKAGRDGTPLLYCANGCDQDALNLAIGREPPPSDPGSAADREADRARKRQAALRLWSGAEPVPGSPAERYLASRHIAHLTACPDLRFRGDTWHPESGKLPAMIALVRDAAGEPLAVHRTFLRRDGSGKADVEPAKASLGPVWGGAVRLAPIAAELVIAEGIETAAAAGLLAGLPAWAAISAGNLATGLVLPMGVRSVVIAVDRDPAGERAAHAVARRWQAEGRHVRLLVPDLPGSDAADVLRAREVAHA